jgi:hypothetical protein
MGDQISTEWEADARRVFSGSSQVLSPYPQMPHQVDSVSRIKSFDVGMDRLESSSGKSSGGSPSRSGRIGLNTPATGDISAPLFAINGREGCDDERLKETPARRDGSLEGRQASVGADPTRLPSPDHSDEDSVSDASLLSNGASPPQHDVAIPLSTHTVTRKLHSYSLSSTTSLPTDPTLVSSIDIGRSRSTPVRGIRLSKRRKMAHEIAVEVEAEEERPDTPISAVSTEELAEVTGSGNWPKRAGPKRKQQNASAQKKFRDKQKAVAQRVRK